MTLARNDTPLRRSEVGSYRRSIAVQQTPVAFNDDEEERRNARRQTLLQQSETSSIEDNETIKKCLEMHNTNKFSRDNAWSTSMIDILSSLLERHRRSLRNFKVAGSSLEASSKIYGLRVDSLHTDVLRMAAGLNAKKFSEKDFSKDDDDLPSRANDAATSNDENRENIATAKPKKRARKVVSTVTKNKETLNARLDTLPLQDPIFGKLDSIIGSDNSSNRVMLNILPTKVSELMLRTNYRFWDASELPADIDYTEEKRPENFKSEELVHADLVQKLAPAIMGSELVLRGLRTGYIITDTPNRPDQATATNANNYDDAIPSVESTSLHDDADADVNPQEFSVAFDLNAECEPMPMELDNQPTVIEMLGCNEEVTEVTVEDREILKSCRNILKPAVFIDDLRPVDGRSKLEYSYRPMDKISQFWAGPSHWKFKKPRNRSTMQSQYSEIVGTAAQRCRRPAQSKRCAKLNFGVYQESGFVGSEVNMRLRRANFQKKWDARKLRLPVDMKIDRNIFSRYEYVPSLSVQRAQPDISDAGGDDDDDEEEDIGAQGEAHFNEYAGDDLPEPMNANETNVNLLTNDNNDAAFDALASGVPAENDCNNTVLEIATEYAGAPVQLTKIVVPFAKRAKVIDMKNLKRTCSSLISCKLKVTANRDKTPTANNIIAHPTVTNEAYANGYVSFKDIYGSLPSTLAPSMAEAVTPSIALYSILHLANDQHYRLFPQQDLIDFKIRQIAE